MKTLQQKIKKSRQLIHKIGSQYTPEKIAVAWTGGKDSTVLLDLVRRAYNNQVPFKVFFNDSTLEFPEVYQFVKRITQQWQLDLLQIKPTEKELAGFNQSPPQKQKELLRKMKISAINRAIKQYHFSVFLSAIRRDEHPARAQEKFLSPRKDHLRVHPVLHFTEKDIWDYVKQENVPYVPLYDQGYRSLGAQPFTKRAQPGKGERSGREKDKEEIMERLRALGYW